ncbi:hypothetical protein [Kushneria phosphatilytica]|uniref:Uncharacterized protein n=1 Tax=Kushneria phosphatilytica TaxID=657387 RepID=A0A5C0ZTQ9_9GAMM|nr:hypothetical protein [Kushneria phosphatilytica]QEL09910.1 hypothetical protein FY550_01350 [Kushneria phosphatilytica]
MTEISNKNPLFGYSLNAITEEVAYNYKKIEGALNNYLKIESSLNGVAMPFLSNSRFWNVRPSSRDSIIILGLADPSIPTENVSSDNLDAYKPFSHGINYYLVWSSIESEIKRLAVLQLYRMAKPDKSSKKDAQKARTSF